MKKDIPKEFLKQYEDIRDNLEKTLNNGGGPQKLDSVLSSDSDHLWRI